MALFTAEARYASLTPFVCEEIGWHGRRFASPYHRDCSIKLGNAGIIRNPGRSPSYSADGDSGLFQAF